MATILAFNPAPRRPARCPTISAASHAAAATHLLCEARRSIMSGDSAETVARALDAHGLISCLAAAALHAVDLIGDAPRDDELRDALQRWLGNHGRPST